MAVETLDITSWSEQPSVAIQQQAITALENGKVVFIPELPFKLHPQENIFLKPEICAGNRKNISYDIRNDKLGGLTKDTADAMLLKNMLHRYALDSNQLLKNLFPHYTQSVKQARTSYRPVEIAGRVAPSIRKDDTRLHIDAFPASPTQGKRILRVFTNVNPYAQVRVWRIGEAFNNVVNKFAPQVKAPLFGSAWLQKMLKITKGTRTLYDHYMLHVHNSMKYDEHYQQNVSQQEFHFPPHSTWIVYTDQVSHAAMAGQYVFEQTFYLPVNGLQDKATAPLSVLEKLIGKKLI